MVMLELVVERLESRRELASSEAQPMYMFG